MINEFQTVHVTQDQMSVNEWVSPFFTLLPEGLLENYVGHFYGHFFMAISTLQSRKCGW